MLDLLMVFQHGVPAGVKGSAVQQKMLESFKLPAVRAIAAAVAGESVLALSSIMTADPQSQ